MTAGQETDAAPETTQHRVSDYTPSEIRKTLRSMVDRCKMTDGTVPDETYLLVSKEDLRHLVAAERMVDNLAIISSEKAKSRGTRR